VRALWEPRTPLRLVHLLLVAFPLGLAEFVLLVTGLVLGIGTVVLFGVPLLVGLMLAWRRLARLERRLLGRLHGLSLPDPYRALTAPTRLGRVRERLADPATWRDLAYLLLAFPLGLVSFTLTLTAVATTLALLTAPVWAQVSTPDGFLFGADTPLEGLAIVPLSLLAGVLTLALVRALSALYGAVARLFLTAAPDPELTSRVSALEDARARIIAAADAERRRLERDLHDGAQQRLVAVSQRRLAKGQDASALVAQADLDAREAVAELRDLARGAPARGGGGRGVLHRGRGAHERREVRRGEPRARGPRRGRGAAGARGGRRRGGRRRASPGRCPCTRPASRSSWPPWGSSGSSRAPAPSGPSGSS